MTDTPKTNHQVTTPDGKLNLDPAKKLEVKTYDFSKEEQDFLQPRQVLINQKKVEIADIDFSMQQFIIQTVLPRNGVDPKKWNIQFNVATNKITCMAKPPEILVPPNDIIIPGKK